MIKKTLYLLCILFVFLSNAIMADTMYRQKIVKINDIKMYKDAANEIFKNAKNDLASIVTVRNEAIDADTAIRGSINVYIKNYELMDMVAELYYKAIANNDDNKNIVCETKKLKDGKEKIVVFVNKKKNLVDSLIIDRE